VADIVDDANDIIQRGIETILVNKRKEMERKLLISQEECEDCGIMIPLERRLAVTGCERCFSCQSVYEKGIKKV
jgi:phage/conjugal plasmid C-4 type zinc finger TraR family protein